MEKKFKYRCSEWGEPELVEIEKETDSFVHVKGQRSKDKKITSWHRYFDTLDEAKKWRTDLALRDIDIAKESLIEAEQDYKSLLKEMKTWK